jgi:hypothetical protein
MKLFTVKLEKSFGLRSELIQKFEKLGFLHYKKTEIVPKENKKKNDPYHLHTVTLNTLYDCMVTRLSDAEISTLDLSNLPELTFNEEIQEQIFKEHRQTLESKFHLKKMV